MGGEGYLFVQLGVLCSSVIGGWAGQGQGWHWLHGDELNFIREAFGAVSWAGHSVHMLKNGS